jgi:2-polyprenyl-3-methyl-5-hydroxy-6-metoxy-1,4-benzoquinol methylase
VPDPISPLVELLRCVGCGGEVRLTSLVHPGGYPELGPDGTLECRSCAARYPVVGGTARMMSEDRLAELRHGYPRAKVEWDGVSPTQPPDAEAKLKWRTAESFAYEWRRFGDLRKEWRRNFLDYMRPHSPEWFAGKLVLDVGAGSGRHSYHAHRLGARTVAVDLGQSIDVARRNLPPDALTVQADAESLPFERDTFDLVMSIGVLHHLPDTGRALRAIVPYARPGGHIQVYLYWQPLWRWHRALLRLVSLARRVTVRMPHRLLHVLCYPLAAILFALFVMPYRALRRAGPLRPLAEALPLKLYADYPFAVCVNDQFDRLSAPLERRFEREEVDALLRSAGLEERQVIANHGWLGSARRPGSA